jgi:hypothetical protein
LQVLALQQLLLQCCLQMGLLTSDLHHLQLLLQHLQETRQQMDASSSCCRRCSPALL